MTKPRAKPDMPPDTCGTCLYCHPIDQPGKPFWCFVEPPFPFIGDEPVGMPNRGAETKATLPACRHFKPKGVH